MGSPAPLSIERAAQILGDAAGADDDPTTLTGQEVQGLAEAYGRRVPSTLPGQADTFMAAHDDGLMRAFLRDFAQQAFPQGTTGALPLPDALKLVLPKVRRPDVYDETRPVPPAGR